MKKILLVLFVFASAVATNAQILLEQDFQGFANGGDIPFVEEPDDAFPEDWLNIDLDNLPANATGPQNWFGTDDYLYIEQPEIVGDTNFIMGSQSWLVGFEPGNRNYLITPEIEVVTGTVLTFSVGVRQAPRYADGLSVLVTPDGDISDVESNFTDNIFTQAQMVEETSWNEEIYGDPFTGCIAGNELDIAAYCWYPAPGDGTNGTGYLHADAYTNEEYLLIDAVGTNYVGLLEPHTVSLEAYAGTTIRIAFLHDSDDDNLIGVDDIIVEVASPDAVAEFTFDQLVNVYPNPATEALNIDFSEFVKEMAQVNIYDASGKIVSSTMYSGAQLLAFQAIDVADLPVGIYSLRITVDQVNVVGKNFLKK